MRNPTEIDGGTTIEDDGESLVLAGQKMADENGDMALDVRHMRVIRCGAQNVPVANTGEGGVLRDLGPACALPRPLPNDAPRLLPDLTDQGLL